VNLELSRTLTKTAADACGAGQFAESFSSYSEYVLGQNGSMPVDLYKQLADVRNTLVIGIEPYYQKWRDGDSVAATEYEKRMRALKNVVEAWISLQTPIT
jgi:hypothetical protein